MTKQLVLSKTATAAAIAATQARANVVFEAADNASASYAVKLAELGLDTKAQAKPFAMKWASVKYKARIEPGQRGDTLPRNSDAERAMYRVLAAIYGSSNPFENGKGAKDHETVALPRGLVSKVRAEIVAAGCTKRQFNALIKALREEITFA